ncbi:putative ubiquitin-like-specific protease 2A isoform X7 [Silene latifolia]|uniref:putative ubiquitin-like-specific protease 2A isoform X7 n=1 Tax=Silene latifolia TaxID=37657 RepID=UPI003D7759E4
MKQLMRNNNNNNRDDKDVFEFDEDEFPDGCDHWSKIRAKFSNPNSKNHDVSEPVIQIKEVLTVTLDDNDHYCTDDIPADALDSAHKAGLKESEDLYSMSDRVVKQSSGFIDCNAEQKVSPCCRQIRDSTPLELFPRNGHVCTMIPDSPCCDDPVYFGDSDENDVVQESPSSTPTSELEEDNVAAVGQAQCQSVGGLEMGVMETIIVRTDYVTYGDKYFPASLILFSKDSVKIKARTVEEESADSSSDWKIDDILKIETQWSSTTVAKVRILLLANNDVHVEIANGTSGNELVEFLASNWSEHQEQIMSLDVRYNALLSMGINMQNCNGDVVPYEDYEYSSDPYIPNFEEPFEEVVYPKGERDAVSVRKSDVDLLLPDVFINDTIIDFYITYLKNGIPHERRDNFHFFSCFFFRKLADLDKNPSSVFDGKAAFQRVQRWTRKINIFEKDYIFIPVNYNLHWSLIILCHPGEVANFNDENINEALKVPCILHMDSIRGSHAGLKDHFQSYLLEEWKERQKETSEDVYLKFLDLRFLSLELPQQENYSDCGLFLLHYAELFINEAPQNFSPFRINKFDHFLRPNWFIPAEASLKRVYIQRLIHELLKSLSHECASPPKNDFSHSPALPVNKENDDGIEIISEKESLDKSWKGSSLYSQSVQGMDMSVLDMPIYRPSHRVNSSGLGMTELLEQQSQRYDRGASLGQLGFSTSTIREEEGNEHLIHSIMGQTGHQPTDQVGDSHMNCSSRDFDQTISWNSDSSYQVEPEDLSSSSESHSCDDSSDTRILEFANGIQSIDPCSNENTDLSKENMNSPEGFASASSDMMETPAEDSQELAEKYGSHDQDDPSLSNPEHEVEGSQELVSISLSGVDDKLAVEDGKTEDDEVVAAADVDNLVVEDSESEDDEILMGADADNLAVEHSKSEDDEIVTGADRVVEDSPDKPRPAKRLRVSPSPDEEDRV